MTFEQYQRDVQQKIATVNVVIIGKGKNYHGRVQLDVSKTNTIPAQNTTYKIDPEGFFLKRRNFLSQRLPRKQEEYTILFQQGKPDPLIVKKDDKGITAKMLKAAKDSSVAKKAMDELFARAFSFSVKKLLFVGVVIGVVAVAYFVFTGQLDLGALV